MYKLAIFLNRNSYSFLALVLAIVDIAIAITTVKIQGKVEDSVIVTLWAFRGAIATIVFFLALLGNRKHQNKAITIIALTLTVLALTLEIILGVAILWQLIWEVLKWLSHLIIRPW
ncbi:hypothetical protein [Pseudanabaena yagii]|uniref:DUF5658 domain-containing protein n=1 Tax=Pseudanabaena yagii GIHE-NHR1 TaxID=2722753 RepID=A0ABX1LYZ0_9CYAN|nr:hypothetical protein [Pseudanabaena yagii]NMF60176.1 hypothetical protein [Pseudanabaena yagii GIHE-NHR1]